MDTTADVIYTEELALHGESQVLSAKDVKVLEIAMWTLFGVGLIVFPMLFASWCIFGDWIISNRRLQRPYHAIKIASICWISVLGVFLVLGIIAVIIFLIDYSN